MWLLEGHSHRDSVWGAGVSEAGGAALGLLQRRFLLRLQLPIGAADPIPTRRMVAAAVTPQYSSLHGSGGGGQEGCALATLSPRDRMVTRP